MKTLAGIVLIALLGAESQTDKNLKAAFIFNFAKFTEWPGLTPGAPIVACIVGDDWIVTALQETVRGQTINGHAVDVQATKDNSMFRFCHLVFVGAADPKRVQTTLTAVTSMPVLTVSDGKGFAQAGGIIELYVEDGRMRFAINVRVAERSGLHLSSRLLDLARIVRGPHVP